MLLLQSLINPGEVIAPLSNLFINGKLPKLSQIRQKPSQEFHNEKGQNKIVSVHHARAPSPTFSLLPPAKGLARGFVKGFAAVVAFLEG